jgi:hypothetical protein
MINYSGGSVHAILSHLDVDEAGADLSEIVLLRKHTVGRDLRCT